VILQDVTIKYGDVTAVDSFSASLKPGSTGLLGVNGAGKSSLIKALLGLVPFQSGSATLLGKDVRSDPRSIRQHVGYMPEDDCLIPGLSGMGLVQYAGELCGMRREDAIQRAHEVLYLVGLEEARYRKVETYSSGMKQRIKLAQALVHDPEFLFLDEPTSGMDPRGRQEMLDLIQTISMQGRISIMLASHILVDVERTCEHILIMHKGRLVKQAQVADLRGTYSGAYSVRVEGDRAAFERVLKKGRCALKQDGEHLLDVTLPENKGSELILKAAQESNVSLRRLVPSIQNLEDVFVKLIGEKSNADL
jgi:ABC-2 type transport system ATP-binding protein